MPDSFAQVKDDSGDQAQALDRRRNRLVWFLFLAAAVVCFELTANPALSVALGCLKFGWHDFQLGHRLKRADHDRKRGRVCARFYLAWGLWKISIAALFMMFGAVLLCTALEAPNPNAKPGMPDSILPTFVTASLLAMFGFELSALVSGFAVLSALRHRIRVWVGERRNHAKTILLSALITNSMAALIFSLIFGTQFLKGPVSPVLAMIMMFSTLLLLPVVILVLLGAIERRILATTPQQCWPVPLDLNVNAKKEAAETWYESYRGSTEADADRRDPSW